MRILGIDPGTVICGYGVVELSERGVITPVGYGVIRAQKGAAKEMPERLERVFKGVTQVIETYAPTAFAIEEAFVWKNVRSALAIGQGRAVAILAGRLAGLPIAEYQPSIVKKSVTGSGRAKKEQVQAMVTTLLGLDEPPHPADAADALAVAFTHAHRVAGVNLL
ncbi:MAG: crossover junction endodeoxyribonuclease RuvC [Planctomycetota bacterium]